MRYLKVLIIIFAIIAAMIFGIQNPQEYSLSFLSYKLYWPVPLWALLMLSFMAGMLPIIITGLPEKIGFIKRQREFKLKKKVMEKTLNKLS